MSYDKDERGAELYGCSGRAFQVHKRDTAWPPDVLGPGVSSVAGAQGVRQVEVRLTGKIAEDAGFCSERNENL